MCARHSMRVVFSLLLIIVIPLGCGRQVEGVDGSTTAVHRTPAHRTAAVSAQPLEDRLRELLLNPPPVDSSIQQVLATQFVREADPVELRRALQHVAEELAAEGHIRLPHEHADDREARRRRAIAELGLPILRNDFGGAAHPVLSANAEAEWQPLSREFANAKGLHTLVVRLEEGKRELLSREAELRGSRSPEEFDPGQLADEQRAELETIIADRRRLDAALDQIAIETAAAWEEAEARSSIIRRDLKEMSDELDLDAALEGDRETAAFLRDRLYNGDSASQMLTSLDRREGRFADMTDRQRQQAKAVLETQVRNQRLDRLQKGSDAVEAFSYGANLLAELGLIDAEEHRQFQQGVQAANYALEMASGLVSGNPFAAVSGAVQFVSVLLGKEPPPDPAAVRHEQVMTMLNHLAEGQQRILDSLVQLSEQIHEQFLVLHDDLDELRKISLSTQRLIVEHQIRGLDRAQWFIEGRRSHNGSRGENAVSVADFSSYDALRDHFHDHSNTATGRDYYQSAIRFLDDQTRGRPSALLQYGSTEGELKNAADAINARLERLQRFITKYVRPEHQSALIGSLCTPENTLPGLRRKLTLLTETEPADAYVLQTWDGATREFDLLDNTATYFDPGLVRAIANARMELLPYNTVIDRETGQPVDRETLSDPRFAPLPAITGDTWRDETERHLRPLRDTRRLLSQSTAQNALLSGDVLLPILSQIVISKRGEMAVDHGILDDARAILAENPIILQNAIRYHFYLQAMRAEENSNRAVEENWRQVRHLLNAETLHFPEVPPVPFSAPPANMTVAYRELADLKQRYDAAKKRRDDASTAHSNANTAWTKARRKRSELKPNALLPSIASILLYEKAKKAADKKVASAKSKAAEAAKAHKTARDAFTRVNRACRKHAGQFDVGMFQVERKDDQLRFVMHHTAAKEEHRAAMPNERLLRSRKLRQTDALWSLQRTQHTLTETLIKNAVMLSAWGEDMESDRQFRREHFLRVLHTAMLRTDR